MKRHALMLVLILMAASWSVAQADVLMVTNTNDDGPGSLRQCIADAMPGDEIQFDPSLDGQPIRLHSPLWIASDLTITGRGAGNTILIRERLIVSADCTATISGIAIRLAPFSAIKNLGELMLTDSIVDENEGSPAGGIVNMGTMIVENSIVSSNRGDFISNGGIFNDGVMIIDNTTIRDNWGLWAGGLFSSGMLTITNSTIRDNTGGGILYVGEPFPPREVPGHGGGVCNAGERARLEVLNTTISGNFADYGGLGGGVLNLDGVVMISSSTVTANNAGHGDNFDNSGEAIVANSVVAGGCSNAATVRSLGHNLDSDGTCGFNHPTDLPNTDPMLGPLQDNYGPTQTHVPLEGSPVIDSGICLPETDQRGVPRPIDGNLDNVWPCDIGAVEYVPHCDGPDRPCDDIEYKIVGPGGEEFVLETEGTPTSPAPGKPLPYHHWIFTEDPWPPECPEITPYYCGGWDRCRGVDCQFPPPTCSEGWSLVMLHPSCCGTCVRDECVGLYYLPYPDCGPWGGEVTESAQE